MNKIKGNKNKYLYILSIIILVFSYASVKLSGVFLNPDKRFSILLCVLYVVLIAAVLLICVKNKSPFFGLLSALMGYKMLPVSIPFLEQYSREADLLYYIAGRVSVVLFVALIVKFYSMQEKPRAIKPLPILAIMLCIPFFNEIIEKAGKFFTQTTGSMLSEYLIGFALYAFANIIILLIAYKSGYESMRFTAYFEFMALGINVLRKASAVVVLAAGGSHISKSIYCWIAVYAGLIVIAYIMKQHAKNKRAC